MCWVCVGGVLVVCWRCVGGVLAVCWRCVGEVTFNCQAGLLSWPQTNSKLAHTSSSQTLLVKVSKSPAQLSNTLHGPRQKPTSPVV